MRLLVVDHTCVLRSSRERYVRLLQRAPVDLTLLTPERWEENAVMTGYQPGPSERFRTISGRVVWPGREQRAFYMTGMIRAFLASRPDVIFMFEEAFSITALQVVLLSRILAPSARIIFYNNHIGSFHRFSYRPSWFYRVLARVVGGMCDVGLCVNDRALQMLRSYGIVRDARKMFYGVDETMFVPVQKEAARRAIGVPADSDLFLYAGRLLKLKGVQDLIEAFARLHAELPGRRMLLMIVGDGEYAAELRRQAAGRIPEGSVEFRRAVPVADVTAYISAATAFVLPSRREWNEQFGRVNAEAMLLGTPVIGSTSGQIPAVIGPGGFIFEAGDVQDLKRTMHRVLTESGEVLRRVRIGRDLSMREYSLNGFVDSFHSLLLELSQG